MKYCIVTSWDYYPDEARKEFLQKVQKSLDMGWRPIGGLCSIVVPSEEGLLPKIYYFQACVLEDEKMPESKMQYLISLSDETIEKVRRLEKEWKVERDTVVTQAIDYIYQSNYDLNRKLPGEAAQETASNLTIALLQQSLDEGRTIHIPSLGITIQTKEE